MGMYVYQLQDLQTGTNQDNLSIHEVMSICGLDRRHVGRIYRILKNKQGKAYEERWIISRKQVRTIEDIALDKMGSEWGREWMSEWRRIRSVFGISGSGNC